MERILVIDDDKDLCFNLSSILKDEGYDVLAVEDGREALKILQGNCPDLVLLDMRLPEMDGMKILEKMKELNHNLAIIMLTAYSDVKDAVKAMRLGAYDYITKPFDNEELILIIKKALSTQYLSREVETLRRRLGERLAIEEVMGESPQIKRVLKQVEIVAPTNLTVIIQGESGTGKELIANLIQQKSLRKDKPFIPIDCGAIPETLMESELFGYEKGAFTGADNQKEGKFEQANTGTLFLDEITNLSDGMQAKLLRVIQERRLQHLGGKKDIRIDVRLLVASKINLAEALRLGKFRDDLFHRLNEFLIELPRLCERKEDIPILSKYFLEEASSEFNKKIEEITGETMRLFLNYHWPGNVRELKNVVRKAVLLADSGNITPDQVLLNSNTSFSKEKNFCYSLDEGNSLREITKEATKEIEKDVIKQALVKSGGNKTKAAKILKIDRSILYSKMKEFQLQ